MNFRDLGLALSFFLINVSTVSATPSTLVGDEIDAAIIRNVDEGYGTGRATGFGLDSTFIVQDGSADTKQYSSIFNLDVNGDNFTVQFLTFAGWQNGISLKLSDLQFSPTSYLSSIDVDTNLIGYTLSFGADFLDLNWGNTQFTQDTYFVGKFITTSSITPVPEPKNYAMMLVGLYLVRVLVKKHKS